MSNPLPSLAAANLVEEAVTMDYRGIVAPIVADDTAPVDVFYAECRHLIVRSADAEPWLLRLILLDLLSATERYVRHVLTRCVTCCHRCRSKAADQMLSLGATTYYSDERLGFALMEGGSLSGADEIKKKIGALTGLQVLQRSSTETTLTAFGKVCQLRHAIVHARGELGSRNVAEIGVPGDVHVQISLTAVSMQPIIVICRNAVRALNNFLFSGILERWISEGDLVGVWTADRERIENLCRIFVSTEDETVSSPEQFHRDVIARHIAARHG